MEKSPKAVEQKYEDFGETITRDFSESLLSSMFYLTSRPKVKRKNNRTKVFYRKPVVNRDWNKVRELDLEVWGFLGVGF